MTVFVRVSSYIFRTIKDQGAVQRVFQLCSSLSLKGDGVDGKGCWERGGGGGHGLEKMDEIKLANFFSMSTESSQVGQFSW